MRHERFKRRVLYGLTGFSWLVCAHFVWAAIYYETIATRVWLMVALVVSATMSTASLFTAFVAPLEHVYRAGYEAQLRAAHVVDEPRRAVNGPNVISIRRR